MECGKEQTHIICNLKTVGLPGSESVLCRRDSREVHITELPSTNILLLFAMKDMTKKFTFYCMALRMEGKCE